MSCRILTMFMLCSMVIAPVPSWIALSIAALPTAALFVCTLRKTPVPRMTGRKKIALTAALPKNFCRSSTATKNENTKHTGTLTSRSTSEPAAIGRKF